MVIPPGGSLELQAFSLHSKGLDIKPRNTPKGPAKRRVGFLPWLRRITGGKRPSCPGVVAQNAISARRQKSSKGSKASETQFGSSVHQRADSVPPWVLEGREPLEILNCTARRGKPEVVPFKAGFDGFMTSLLLQRLSVDLRLKLP